MKCSLLTLFYSLMFCHPSFAGKEFQITGEWTSSNTYSMQTTITHTNGPVQNDFSAFDIPQDSSSTHERVLMQRDAEAHARARIMVDATQKCKVAVQDFAPIAHDLMHNNEAAVAGAITSVENTIQKVKEMRNRFFGSDVSKYSIDSYENLVQAEQTIADIKTKAALVKAGHDRMRANALVTRTRIRTFDEVKEEMADIQKYGSTGEVYRPNSLVQSDYDAYVKAEEKAAQDWKDGIADADRRHQVWQKQRADSARDENNRSFQKTFYDTRAKADDAASPSSNLTRPVYATCSLIAMGTATLIEVPLIVPVVVVGLGTVVLYKCISEGVVGQAVSKWYHWVFSNPIEDIIGDDPRVITNEDGDKIFISKDGKTKVRFDIENPHGDRDGPHMHIQKKTENGNWRDYFKGNHRFYPGKKDETL